MAKKGGGKMGMEPTLAEYVDAERRARRAQKLFTPPTMKKLIEACKKIDFNSADPDAKKEFTHVCNDVLKTPADGTTKEITEFIEDIWAASKASRAVSHEFKPCW